MSLARTDLYRPVIVPLVLALAGCHNLALKGLDQAQLYGAESHPAPDIQVPDGFRAVRIVQGLDYPSAITFDEAGRLYILESHTVPVPLTKRRILKVVKEHLEEVELRGDARVPESAAYFVPAMAAGLSGSPAPPRATENCRPCV